jgi:peptidoglycan/LPS O-acetylase OafA/YrhL
MEGDVLLAILFIAAMLSGVFIIFLAMRQHSEVMERQHRERMAMIERGHIPQAEAKGRDRGSSRSLSLGIIVVGLGLALMTIISVAGGSPDAGIGVGGAIVIIGAAFIVRSLVVRPDAPAAQPPPPLPPPKDLA